jgi:Dna[CI] antecedent, DciA
VNGPRSLKALIAGWTPRAPGPAGSGSASLDEAAAAFAAAWEKAVGAEVARRSRPTKFRNGVLTVLTASSAWSDELSLHAPRIMNVLQRAFPDERLLKLRFMVASGRTKLLLDGERTRGREQVRPRTLPGPHANEPVDDRKAEDIGTTLARVAAMQHTLDAERDRAGWRMCASCERRFAPESSAAQVCAVCADGKRRRTLGAIERALMHAPWLSLADVRQALPHTTATAYERTRQRLLARWQSDVDAAVRRLRRGAPSAEDRVVAWSFVMLQSGLPQRDIGRALVTDVLGRDWTSVLFGDVAPQKQEARRAPRENHTR